MISVKNEQFRLFWAVVINGGLLAVFYQGQIFETFFSGITTKLALSTAEFLKISGLAATAQGNLILTPGTVYEVSYLCTGFLLIAWLAVFMLASFAPPRFKISGIVIGSLSLLVLNQIRIVHVILVGETDPEMFQLVHDIYWNGALILFVLVFFSIWRRWIPYQKGKTRPEFFRHKMA